MIYLEYYRSKVMLAAVGQIDQGMEKLEGERIKDFKKEADQSMLDYLGVNCVCIYAYMYICVCNCV